MIFHGRFAINGDSLAGAVGAWGRKLRIWYPTADAYEQDVLATITQVETRPSWRLLHQELLADIPVEPYVPTANEVNSMYDPWRGKMFYTPALYRNVRPPQPAFFHEMVHALRRQHGHPVGGPVGNYEQEDEIYAVFVENYFRQEVRRPLRRDHADLAGLGVPRDKDWLDQTPGGTRRYWYYVQKFITAHPRLARGLARIQLGWNPVRWVLGAS